MIRNRTKFIIHTFTVAFTTCSSIFENFILFNTFNLDVLGTFFLIQSFALLSSAFVSFRIKEVSQLLLSKKNLSISQRQNSFSEIYAFYIMVLSTLIPFAILLIFILQNLFNQNLLIYMPTIILVIFTFILNQLSGFWFAIQYHNNQSQKISYYQTSKKISSLIIISCLFLIKPNEFVVFFIALSYLLNALIFFIYEYKSVSKILNQKFVSSFRRPFYIFRKIIFSESDISLALKTGYLRTLFSTWAKNGDISIAGIIAGPSGSGLLKAIKSITNLIFQFTTYTESFFMTYINRNNNKDNFLNNLFYKSLLLIPIAILVSIISFYFSQTLFLVIYKIELTNFESLIISILLMIAFTVLIFSWIFPSYLLKNKYKTIMYISFLGTFITYIIFACSFFFKSLIILYFALPIGRISGTISSLILYYKLESFHKRSK